MIQGYTCSKCGVKHKFALWVYAHWDEPVRTECHCGCKHVFIKGKLVTDDVNPPT